MTVDEYIAELGPDVLRVALRRAVVELNYVGLQLNMGRVPIPDGELHLVRRLAAEAVVEAHNLHDASQSVIAFIDAKDEDDE